MRFSVYIPARLDSQRLPRKLLLPLKGKPVIFHTIDKAIASGASHIVVATDSSEIETAIREQFVTDQINDDGVRLQIYRSQITHDSGTSRIAEALVSDTHHAANAESIIVNLQADEPLMPSELIGTLASTLATGKDAFCEKTPMVTLAMPIQSDLVNNPNIVKVVLNQKSEALYFSRSVVPYQRAMDRSVSHLKHLGIYAYRKEFLQQWQALPDSALEQTEMLEQLRVLDAGYKIGVKVVEPIDITGIDSAEQLALAEAYLSQGE